MSAKESPSEVSADDGSRPTVLFVDDDPELLEGYEMLFEGEFAVVTAEGGEAALRTFDDEIDFAFIDRRMPGRSGKEVIETLRERSFDTPIGIISAVDEKRGIDVDHEVYFTKPPNVDRLQEVVHEHTG